jgi:hypothetical protein
MGDLMIGAAAELGEQDRARSAGLGVGCSSTTSVAGPSSAGCRRKRARVALERF